MASPKISMGIGALGFNNLVFKRKFRFSFEITNICGGKSVPPYYVKMAGRPGIEIDETEINFLNGTFWIPGKARWKTIDVSYLDVASADMAPLFTWLASVYNFTDPVNLQMGSKIQDYTATGIVRLWDGCGTLIEEWTLTGLWPRSIDFSDLEYDTSEIAEIKLTLRYAQVSYKPYCPSFAINSCCSPCSN